AAPRRRDRARPRSAVGGSAPAVARPVAAGALFGQSLLGYISPEPARLNGNTFTAVSLPSAAARRCADHASSAARFSSAQSCLLIDSAYASSASAQVIQPRLRVVCYGDSGGLC